MIDVVIQNQNYKFVNCLQICMDSYTIKTKTKNENCKFSQGLGIYMDSYAQLLL